MKSNWVRDHEHMFFNWGAEMSSDFFGDLVQFWLSHKPNYVCLLCVGKRRGPNTHYVENLHLRHTNSLWSRLAFSISSYLVYKVLSTAEPPTRFRWQSLPTDEAGFWEAETFYDEAQTLCDPGWQSQPTIDHNLYTKYLEIERLTLTR